MSNGDTALQTQRCDRNTRLNNLDFYSGLSHIVASNSHIWLGGGGAYAWDENTSARLCTENAGGAYARGGAYLPDTTVSSLATPYFSNP